MSTYRCVVTGKNAEGKSAVIRDERVATRELGVADFWKTSQSPASLRADDWPTGPMQLEPPPSGTIFRFFEIPPVKAGLSQADANAEAAQAFAEVGASHCRVDTQRHPMMHTTATIDYVVILKGPVSLLLDDAEVELDNLDVVVQRGTNHYWINRRNEPALLMGVLLDAQ